MEDAFDAIAVATDKVSDVAAALADTESPVVAAVTEAAQSDVDMAVAVNKTAMVDDKGAEGTGVNDGEGKVEKDMMSNGSLKEHKEDEKMDTNGDDDDAKENGKEADKAEEKVEVEENKGEKEKPRKEPEEGDSVATDASTVLNGGGDDNDETKDEKMDVEGNKKEEEDKVNKEDKENKEEGDKKEEQEEEQERGEKEKESKEPTDEVYFASLPQEELEWYKELGPTPDSLKNKMIACTTCHRQITNTPGNFPVRHPYLGVTICKPCKLFYEDGEWTKDEDGSDEFCRWCANGGDLLLCDKCTHAFCKRCIQRHLGRKALNGVVNSEEWKCLICDPKQIYKFRAQYYAVSQIYRSIRDRPAAAKKPVAVKPEGATDSGASASAASEPVDITFINENIDSALQTLALYQKALDDERERWVRHRDNPEGSADSGPAICKSLRKIYATTQKNMDLLDAALLQSFEKAFPGEKRKVSIPAAAAVKRKAASPVKSAAKKRKRSSTVIELNGDAVTEEFDPSSVREVQTPKRSRKSGGGGGTPASKKKTPNRPGPASKKKTPAHSSAAKVSTNMFKKKKAGSQKKPIEIDASDSDDSDVEVVEKKEKAVTKPSIMRKPGPKSKTMRS